MTTNNDLFLVKINHDNEVIFRNLSHSYEAEFSHLTLKMPDANGLFKSEPEALPSNKYTGYLLYRGTTPIGFCVASIHAELNDIAEFYIVPAVRKLKYGSKLAKMVFDLHPGKWQVRQIAGADHAISFWRAAIREYTNNKFNESVVNDEVWGIVTKQEFVA